MEHKKGYRMVYSAPKKPRWPKNFKKAREPKMYELVPVEKDGTVIGGYKSIFVRELPPTDGVYVLLMEQVLSMETLEQMQCQWDEFTAGKNTPLIIMPGLAGAQFVQIRELFIEPEGSPQG